MENDTSNIETTGSDGSDISCIDEEDSSALMSQDGITIISPQLKHETVSAQETSTDAGCQACFAMQETDTYDGGCEGCNVIPKCSVKAFSLTKDTAGGTYPFTTIESQQLGLEYGCDIDGIFEYTLELWNPAPAGDEMSEGSDEASGSDELGMGAYDLPFDSYVKAEVHVDGNFLQNVYLVIPAEADTHTGTVELDLTSLAEPGGSHTVKFTIK